MALTTKRNLTLDAVRGIAVILVLFVHIYLPSINPENRDVYTYFVKLVSKVKMGGWTGVDLFFVLSGFLISGLLFNQYKKHGSIDLKTFFWRRWYKIIPSFIAFIVIASGIEMLYGLSNPEARYPVSSYLKDLFFLNNYLDGRWDQTWSLDVEEAFYIIFPLFLVCLIRTKRVNIKHFIAGYLFLTSVAVVSRFFANLTPEYSFRQQFALTHLRMDALFFGVLISFLFYLRNDILDRIIKYRFFLIPICIVLVGINFFVWKAVMKSVTLLTTNHIAYGLLMIYALKFNWLNFKPLARLGQYSYNIYLWHYPLFEYSEGLIKLLKINTSSLSGYVTYIIVYLLLGIGIGVLFTHLIEKPFLKLRDKKFSKAKRSFHREEEYKAKPILVHQV